MSRFVLDAFALLMAFFPDEGGQETSQQLLADWVRGEVGIIAPSLLLLETTNAVLVALRRGRISQDKVHDILRAMNGLSIPTAEPLNTEEIFEIAAKHNLSAYDATYATLTSKSHILITGDKKLYDASRGEEQVTLIGKYKEVSFWSGEGHVQSPAYTAECGWKVPQSTLPRKADNVVGPS